MNMKTFAIAFILFLIFSAALWAWAFKETDINNEDNKKTK